MHTTATRTDTDHGHLVCVFHDCTVRTSLRHSSQSAYSFWCTTAAPSTLHHGFPLSPRARPDLCNLIARCRRKFCATTATGLDRDCRKTRSTHVHSRKGLKIGQDNLPDSSSCVQPVTQLFISCFVIDVITPCLRRKSHQLRQILFIAGL